MSNFCRGPLHRVGPGTRPSPWRQRGSPGPTRFRRWCPLSPSFRPSPLRRGRADCDRFRSPNIVSTDAVQDTLCELKSEQHEPDRRNYVRAGTPPTLIHTSPSTARHTPDTPARTGAAPPASSAARPRARQAASRSTASGARGEDPGCAPQSPTNLPREVPPRGRAETRPRSVYSSSPASSRSSSSSLDRRPRARAASLPASRRTGP